MRLKKGNDYLDFNGDIIIEDQVASVETLDTVGTFSYSFTAPPTAKNKKLLGIVSIDSTEEVFIKTDDVELQTDSGLTLRTGSILVTDTVGINCSFVSGNTTFFNSIQGNISDVDLSEFDVLLTEAHITDSWDKTNGVVFPLCDRGQLSLRKDAFMKMRKFNGLVQQNDWQPFIYVKDAIDKCLLKAGLKMKGDLVNDSTYQSLITTNNSSKFRQKKFQETNVSIGKTTPQTISDAGFTQIVFQDDTNGLFFNSIKQSFSLITNRWTILFDSTISISCVFNTSDNTKLIEFQMRVNASGTGFSFFEKGLKISIDSSAKVIPLSHPNDFHANVNDYFSIWARVDSSTPGSVQLLSGSFTGTVQDTSFVFAQALLPQIESKAFIKDIFRLFNVVCSFDSYSKTINTVFFKNISSRPEQDLSDFIEGYSSENGFELVSSYAQSNNLAYKDDSTQEIINYNNANLIPYGTGQIKIKNSFINKTSDLFQVIFTAPFAALYPFFGVQLIKMNFVEYEVNDNTTIDEVITGVTNSGGLAQFNGGSFPVNSTYYNNLFKGDAQGRLQDATIKENDSDNQILAINIPNVDIPGFRFTESSASDFYLVRASNFTIDSYNGDWEMTPFSSANHTKAAIATFALFLDGTELDGARQGLSFGPVKAKDSLTLIDTFYSKLTNTLNKPVKLLANMRIPEKRFINFDFLRPVRIRTKDFNSLFFCQKTRGYKDGKSTCIMELVKIV